MDDLTAARLFYDKRREGVGDYFFDSLFAEIDSLALYADVHDLHFDSIGFWQSGFGGR